MGTTYAIVVQGIVTNLIVWDGPEISPITWPDGWLAVLLPDPYEVSFGWTYTDGIFSPPPESAS